MRVGSRWPVGGTPPAGLPAALLAAIAAEEAPEGESWTLTWLEGRPRVALGREGVELAVTSDGTISRHGGAAVPTAPEIGDTEGPGSGSWAGSEHDTDDDDWLL
ncbi:Fe-S oxidoreductase [Leucobacter sp. M11]|uniref:Fe-S oxidoreductase n=1 Tax=Leucobacter sp. M11 TaxID=2993565 RepID=UPI002D80597A|nr:Fe-S oxidoreductase [Leucobacter sp. M11]MEB4616034.1 Fe-S oxidoreductase [Leucobacter sp. M11]